MQVPEERRHPGNNAGPAREVSIGAEKARCECTGRVVAVDR